MRWIIRVIDTVSIWVGRFASILLVPLVLITTYEVLMRYVVGKPTIWAWDLNIQVFAALVLLGGGDALRQKAHVIVDIFVQGLSPRKRAMLDLFTSPVFFFGLLVLLVGGWEQSAMSWKAREAMPTVWAPPYYTMKVMVPLGAVLVLVQGVAEFMKNLLLVLDRRGKA